MGRRAAVAGLLPASCVPLAMTGDRTDLGNGKLGNGKPAGNDLIGGKGGSA